MIELSSNMLVLAGLVLGMWTLVAIATTAAAARRRDTIDKLENEVHVLRKLFAISPALPVLVEPNGRFEPDNRLRAWLEIDSGLATFANFSALSSLPRDMAAELDAHIIKASAAGVVFEMVLRVGASGRVFRVQGAPSSPDFRAGSVLVWFTDTTASEDRVAALHEEVARLTTSLDALASLIEAAPFPMWHRGPDLRLALVNSAYVRAVEADSALAVIKSGIELVDESEGRNALSQAAEILQNGETVARTLPATIAGERRTVQVVEVPLGEGVAGYAIDVEDREQARADLTRFVLAQRDMLDRLSAGVAQFSRDRNLIFVNQPFARLFSLSPDFLADQPEFDRVIDGMRESGNLPEVRDFPEWKEEKRSWFTSGFSASEEDWLLPEGKHLRVVAQPLPDGGLLIIFEDRTEQLQLASARDTLLRVRAATFDNLFEAVGVFASDGCLHLWNSRFKDVWQFDEELLASHPRVDVLVPHISGKLKRPRQGALVRDLVRSATVERKQRSGHVSLADGRDFEFAAVPLPDGNALFTMLDITDSRMIEAALREKNEALEAADRLKTAFVSNMSYELRTPLTSISGFAEMLAGGYAGKLPQGAIEYITAISDAAQRLGMLIDNVLDLTQGETDRLLLAEDSIDMQALCQEAVAGMKEAAAKKNIDITMAIEPSAGEITGDQRRLRQTLDNILKNAILYAKDSGHIAVSAKGRVKGVEVSITDNGRGISPADQAHVFDRFYRSAARTSGEDAALGLGLPLAKQYVEAHGGTIKLESKPDVGTTVTLFLPRTR